MRAYALSLLAVVASATTSFAATWVNESDGPLEADFANLQFPSSFLGSAGSSSPTIYGRIYEQGVTESAGASGAVTAELGYGPDGTDPRVDPGWSWFNAGFNVQVGNDDEYQGGFTLPIYNGNYRYTYRFSLDAGDTLTAADLDGAGSNAGLTFDPMQMGTFSITDGIVPEPTSLAVCAMSMVLLARRR